MRKADRGMEIKTVDEFMEALGKVTFRIGHVIKEDEKARPLEDYLRALLRLVREQRNAEMTLACCFDLLRQAFTSDPLSFQDEWLRYKRLPDGIPDELFEEHGYTAAQAFEILEKTILCQVVDLRLMFDPNWKHPYHPDYSWGLGIESPNGNAWYNFDTIQYLECACAWLDVRTTGDETTWDSVDFAHLLIAGSVYE